MQVWLAKLTFCTNQSSFISDTNVTYHWYLGEHANVKYFLNWSLETGDIKMMLSILKIIIWSQLRQMLYPIYLKISFGEEQSFKTICLASSKAVVNMSWHFIHTWSFWSNAELRANARKWKANNPVILEMASCHAILTWDVQQYTSLLPVHGRY